MASVDEIAAVEAVADWFENERGITRHTLNAFRVTLENGRVCFPYPNGVKQRPDPTVPHEGRRFYFTEGVAPALFEAPLRNEDVAFLVEGETDTMRMWQEATTADVYGLGGINTWRPELSRNLSQYDRVWVILDNDQDYMVRGQVDDAWRKIRAALGGRAKRITLPADVKDVCEFFDRYDLETLQMLSQRMSVSRYRPVDFNLPVPPVTWLVEGLIAKGDMTLLAGKGGLGKSFVTMFLTAGMLRREAEVLGHGLHSHGRILYIDQENPLDVVHDRMKRLGLDPAQHSGQLRYLWNQGIRLDRDPDTLLDEAMEFQPDLIVLDSLTRLHSKEENVTGQMAPVMNDAIQPLARETGAAVILIHHHDKTGSGPRGSGDIFNSSDACIDVFDRYMPGKFSLKVSKSRRKVGGEEVLVGITDHADGTITLDVDPPLNLQF